MQQEIAATHSSIEFSYAMHTHKPLERAVIKTLERVGGQRRLKSLYDDYVANPHQDASFFAAAVRLLELDVQYDHEQLMKVPSRGPVVFVSNHPYGVIDGLVLAWLAMKVRPDFKLLCHKVLCRVP